MTLTSEQLTIISQVGRKGMQQRVITNYDLLLKSGIEKLPNLKNTLYNHRKLNNSSTIMPSQIIKNLSYK